MHNDENPIRAFTSSPDSILLDADELAQILRVPRSWVYSHLQELPVIRLGRYVRFSRSEVFAGLYPKLLRGYALEAIETAVDKPLRKAAVGRFLGELELAQRVRRPAVGLGEEGQLTEYAVGSELVLDGEVVALSAFSADVL